MCVCVCVLQWETVFSAPLKTLLQLKGPSSWQVPALLRTNSASSSPFTRLTPGT